MNNKRASQDEMPLYLVVGEAMCMLQQLEDAINHSIVLKRFPLVTKIEANEILSEKRKNTLGTAIREAGKHSIFPDTVEKELFELRDERNWFTHGSISCMGDELANAESRMKTLKRIKRLSSKAQKLQSLIENDLIAYCEEKGKSMKNVKVKIKEIVKVVSMNLALRRNKRLLIFLQSLTT